MNKLIETAKELDRILKSGIEILPNSPIHEKLKQALNIACVSFSEAEVCEEHEYIEIHTAMSSYMECRKCGFVKQT